jgi:tetratricopeptide (TPR) repeat protein
MGVIVILPIFAFGAFGQMYPNIPIQGKQIGVVNSVSDLVDSGKAHLEGGKYALAVRSCSAAIRADPKIGEAYLIRGKAFDLLGFSKKASNDFTRYIELHPNDSVGFVCRGDSKNFGGDHREAIQDYNEAIKLSPSNGEAFAGRGLARMGLSEYEEAIGDYETALRNGYANSETFANLGRSLMLIGKAKPAISYLEKALSSESDPRWRAKMENWLRALHENEGKEYGKLPVTRKISDPNNISSPLW